MNRNSQSSMPSTMDGDGKEQDEVKADSAELKSENAVEIIPEHPIAIDTVFRRISLDLDAADLISCSQIWMNCYQITKEIFKETEELKMLNLRELNTTLAEVDKNIGHLILQQFGFFPGCEKIDKLPEILLKPFAEDPKLKYLTQLTIYSPTSICYHKNRNIFNYLMKIIGQRLQQLCIKDTSYIDGLPYSSAGTVEKELFPTPELQMNGREAFRNMKRLELYSNNFELSIIGLAFTFPNLVELNLTGVVMRNITDDSYCIKKSFTKVEVTRSPPQLENLRKLTIHYLRTRSYSSTYPSTATVQLSILTAMQLQLKYLEFVNVSYFAHSRTIMEFLETQSQTLETLHFLSTIDTATSPPFDRENIFLPNVFLQLKEVTLTQLFINDMFRQTLEAIPNATKIVFALSLNDVWESIPPRENSSEIGEPKITPKNVNNNNSQQIKNNSPPTINVNIIEVYINGGIIKEDPWRNLKQIFPNCVNDSLHPKIQF